MSIGVAVVLALYVMGMAFLFWFCVIADPTTSTTARFVAHTMPAKFMQLASKVVGPQGVKIINAAMERAMAILYLAVVLGSFSVLWWFGYPWARESSHIPNYHLTLGYFVLFFALYTWKLTMTTR
jgi:hypothetical protein